MNSEFEQMKVDLAALDLRLAQAERQLTTTLLNIMQGLKGSDDGKDGGLYENVRKLGVEQAALRTRLDLMASTVNQHEQDKQQIVGGTKTLYAAVVAISGLVSYLVSLAK